MTRVGFVGLGNIGKPMATRLASTISLWVYDVVPEAAEGVKRATAAESVADVASRVDVLCVMVRDDDQVRAVAAEALTAMYPPVLVVHSTVAPSTPAEIAATGIRVLDAPVSGGPMGAADGTLAIMVGGSAEDYGVAEPVLQRMGSLIVHAGPLGAGTKMKLARNLIHFVAFTAVTEAQRLAEASGLDLVALGEVVRHTDAITGGPGAIMYRDATAELDPEDFWWGVFDHVRTLGEKDLSFAIELAATLGVDVPLAQLARENLAKGLGL
jgi:3-hydroxyisobutyrate dehydrogenase-like beta-hydroxyacid dehydrogenase